MSDSKIKFKSSVKNISGILLIIFGGIASLGIFSMNTFFSGIIGFLILLLGLFILPATNTILSEKVNYNLTSKMKWLITILGLLVISLLVSLIKTAEEKASDLINAATLNLKEGNIKMAEDKLKQAITLYPTKENEAYILIGEIDKSSSESYAKQVIVNMNSSDFFLLKKKELTKTYFKSQILNDNFYLLLTKYAPQRSYLVALAKKEQEKENLEIQKSREKIEAERALIKRSREKNAKEFEKIKLEKEKKVRAKKMELLFSAWDGRHPELTRQIKRKMNDPDSYEHLETIYRDMETHVYVITKFRGKNAFGGKVINIVGANVDFNGGVIEITGWE